MCFYTTEPKTAPTAPGLEGVLGPTRPTAGEPKLTKFGRFATFIQPILQGALAGAGAATSPSRGAAFGQGFLGAQQFRQQQQQLADARAMREQQMRLAESAEARAAAGERRAQQTFEQDQETRQKMRELLGGGLPTPTFEPTAPGLEGVLGPSRPGPARPASSILDALGELAPAEQARLSAGLVTGRPSDFIAAVDDIYTRRSVEGGRLPQRGDIIPVEVARKQAPEGVELPDSTGFVRPQFDRQGRVVRFDPVLAPPGFRYQISETQQVVVDDNGIVHKVPITRVTHPAAATSGGQPSGTTSQAKGVAPAPPAAAQPAAPKTRELSTEGWNPNAIAPVQSTAAQTAREAVLNTPLSGIRKLSATQKSKLDLLLTIKADVAVLKELYPKYTEFVGPIAGAVTQARINYAGTTSDKSLIGSILPETRVPPEVVDLFAVTQSVQDRELRARSGAQINEQEFARLLKFLPDVTKLADVNLRRLAQFEREIDTMIRQITGGRGVAPPSGTSSGRGAVIPPPKGKNDPLEIL